jgi:uncharacterized protein YdaU (DUF1376 family)
MRESCSLPRTDSLVPTHRGCTEDSFMRSPAFQFYPDDFIGGTVDMTTEEVGSYIRLLCYQWSRGAIPFRNREMMDRIAGVKVSDFVLTKFPDGQNQRLAAERDKQERFRQERAESGIRGAKTRWEDRRSAKQETMAQPLAQPSIENGSAIVLPMAKNSSPVSCLQSPIPIKKKGEDEPPRQQSDSDWLKSLRQTDAYNGIDVDREFSKMGVWCSVNKKQPTRRRFIQWLNRCEVSVVAQKEKRVIQL